MNTTPTSGHATHPHARMAAAAITALTLGFSTLAHSADTAEVPSAVVHYADLDLSSSAGAAALYSRITKAAQRLCAPLDLGSLASRTTKWSCQRNAIKTAVARVDQPSLSAIYHAKNSHDAMKIISVASNR